MRLTREERERLSKRLSHLSEYNTIQIPWHDESGLGCLRLVTERCLLGKYHLDVSWKLQLAYNFDNPEDTAHVLTVLRAVYIGDLIGLEIGDGDCSKCSGPCWTFTTKEWRGSSQDSMLTCCLFCGSVFLGELDMKHISSVWYDEAYYSRSQITGKNVSRIQAGKVKLI